MLVVVGRGAQASVDVPRQGGRMAEDPPAVVPRLVEGVAEHWVSLLKFRHTNANTAPAYGAIASPTVSNVFPTSYAVFAAATKPRPLWTQLDTPPPNVRSDCLSLRLILLKTQMSSSSPVPLLTAAMTGTTYDTPVGLTGSPASAHVTLTLSDGTIQTVFENVLHALSLLWKMRGNRAWMMYASEDVVCVSVCGVKMLVMETSLINQRLLNLYAPIYMGGKVRWQHRSQSLVLDTGDALRSVGSFAAGRLQTNADLAPWGIQAVDWDYVAATVLEDTVPLIYSF